MNRYFRQENGDRCPRTNHVVCEPLCKDCQYRGSMWIKRTGNITIQCSFDGVPQCDFCGKVVSGEEVVSNWPWRGGKMSCEDCAIKLIHSTMNDEGEG